MRLTVVLHKQHLHRWFTRFWYVKGKNRRVAVDTGAEAKLEALGIKMSDPQDLFQIKPRQNTDGFSVVGHRDKPVPLDENHPSYHERSAFLYGENSVLVEGLPQAQNLTNTVILKQGLPDKIEKMAEENHKLLPQETDDKVKSCILRSQLLDAVQEKLPKRKDPERYFWNYPRDFGVPDYRRNRLMSENLLALCNSLSSEPHGMVTRFPQLRTFLDHGEDLVRFHITPGMLLCGKNPLAPHVDPASTSNLELPDIAPFQPFVSIETDHFYEDTEIIDVPESKHVHNAVFHFNETSTVNVTEIPVNQNQIHGRTLVNSYITALALAKQKHQNPTGVLKKPVTVQTVHTDGQWFQFAVMQLNNAGHQGVKNVAWLSPVMHMFSLCKYVNGKPTLTGYDPAVFRYLFAFYRNSLDTK